MASDSENYKQLKQDILNCLRDQEESITVFKRQIQNKDVIIFLGNTRSGKSTLVNYIIGTKLEAWESGKMEFKIKEMGESNGPIIGQGSLSCTALPGVYPLQGCPDVVVVDPPGFEDNRGVVQDIINALCISQIKAARTVKFILVFDINEITNDNIRNFTNGLEQVQTLVCNFHELKNSFSVIFTKDWKNYTQTEMVELFRHKILNVEQFDIDKVLIRNFADNQKMIGIFKMPQNSGKILNELDLNVKGAIQACHTVDVEKCDTMFALSDKAQEALLEIYPEYTDTNYFENEVNKITERYVSYFNIDKYVFASYDEELKMTRSALETISSSLQTHRDENHTHLYQIQLSLDKLLRDRVSAEFRMNFKFIMMLDECAMLEEKYKTMIVTNYVNSLAKQCKKVDDLLKKIETEQNERRKNQIIFGVGGLTTVLGAGPAAVGAAKVIDCAVKMGSSVRKVTQPGVAVYGACEAAVGGAATLTLCIAGAAVAGAGAGSAYVLYKQTYGKRIEARQAQNRQ